MGTNLRILSGETLSISVRSSGISLSERVLGPVTKDNRLCVCRDSRCMRSVKAPTHCRGIYGTCRAKVIRTHGLRGGRGTVFLSHSNAVGGCMKCLARPRRFRLLPNITRTVHGVGGSKCLTVIIAGRPKVTRKHLAVRALRMVRGGVRALLKRRNTFVGGLCCYPRRPSGNFRKRVPRLGVSYSYHGPGPKVLLRTTGSFGVSLTTS